MDSETDFSSDSDYNEFPTEMLFVGIIPQLFHIEYVFTAVKIQAKNT